MKELWGGATRDWCVGLLGMAPRSYSRLIGVGEGRITRLQWIGRHLEQCEICKPRQGETDIQNNIESQMVGILADVQITPHTLRLFFLFLHIPVPWYGPTAFCLSLNRSVSPATESQVSQCSAIFTRGKTTLLFWLQWSMR